MNWRTIEVYSDTAAAHEPSNPRACGNVFLDISRVSLIQTYFRNDDFVLLGYPTGGYPYLVRKEDGDEIKQKIIEVYA